MALEVLTVYDSSNSLSAAIRQEIYDEPTFNKTEIDISGLSEAQIDTAISRTATGTYDAIYICVYSAGTFVSGKITNTQQDTLEAKANPAPFTHLSQKQRRPTSKIDCALDNIRTSLIDLPYVITNLVERNNL